MWILGKREPYWKPGGPARQEGEKAGSWLQTAKEKRHSKMSKDAGNGLATPSRGSYAQSECFALSPRRPYEEYKRMVLEHTHGLFIT